MTLNNPVKEVPHHSAVFSLVFSSDLINISSCTPRMSPKTRYVLRWSISAAQLIPKGIFGNLYLLNGVLKVQRYDDFSSRLICQCASFLSSTEKTRFPASSGSTSPRAGIWKCFLLLQALRVLGERHSLSDPSFFWTIAMLCTLWTIAMLCTLWTIAMLCTLWTIAMLCTLWTIAMLCTLWTIAMLCTLWTKAMLCTQSVCSSVLVIIF